MDIFKQLISSSYELYGCSFLPDTTQKLIKIRFPKKKRILKKWDKQNKIHKIVNVPYIIISGNRLYVSKNTAKLIEDAINRNHEVLS